MSDLNLFSQEPVSLLQFLFNLGVGIGFAVLLRWHFGRFASSLSNRGDFSDVFPFVLLTTLLIITVVKSSLALSLGLVGALSIVRFRTPIKEPEELAYLFIAIAIGVGLGASQTVVTTIAVLIILTVIAVMKRVHGRARWKSLYLAVDVPARPEGADVVAGITEAVLRHTETCDLHRVDLAEGSAHVTYYLDLEDSGAVSALTEDLERVAPGATVTLIDQRRIPGV